MTDIARIVELHDADDIVGMATMILLDRALRADSIALGFDAFSVTLTRDEFRDLVNRRDPALHMTFDATRPDTIRVSFDTAETILGPQRGPSKRVGDVPA